jgi:hypothetical protein
MTAARSQARAFNRLRVLRYTTSAESLHLVRYLCNDPRSGHRTKVYEHHVCVPIRLNHDKSVPPDARRSFG